MQTWQGELGMDLMGINGLRYGLKQRKYLCVTVPDCCNLRLCTVYKSLPTKNIKLTLNTHLHVCMQNVKNVKSQRASILIVFGLVLKFKHTGWMFCKIWKIYLVLHMDPLSLILGYPRQDTIVDANSLCPG